MTDWRDMTRSDFDAAAPPEPLFDLAPANVPGDDLLALLPAEEE